MNNPDTSYAMRRISVLSLAIAMALPALSPGVALAQAAEETIEEVTAYGVRRSLDNAADIKRDSDAIVDAITAEDIGLFSDNNMGEALQRVPGVQLERSEGEGFRISIRGLGPRFVRTTLNGRTALSSPGGEGGSDARGFSFNIVPSEVIAGAKVVKSTQASDVEGGIGGVVDLQTTRPLDLAASRKQDLYVSGAVRGTQNDLGDTFSNRTSLFLNNKVSETFGVFISGVFDQNEGIQDSSESQDFDVHDFRIEEGTLVNGEVMTEGLCDSLGFDWSSSRTNCDFGEGPADSGLGLFDGIRNHRRERERDRLTFTGGMQWQPNDNLEVYVDWTHSEQDEDREDFRHWLRVADTLNRLDRSDTPTSISEIWINFDDADEFSDGTVLAYSFENYNEDRARQIVDVAHLLLEGETTSDVGGINFKWSNDVWTAAFDVGYASQDREFLQRRVAADVDFSDQNDPARFPLYLDTVDDPLLSGINGTFDIRDGWPNVQYWDVNGVPLDVMDASYLNYDSDRQTYITEDNSEASYRLDFTRDVLFDDPDYFASWFDDFKFGYAYRERKGFRNELRTEGQAGTRNNGEFADIGMEQFGLITISDFMGQISDPNFTHRSYVVPDTRGWIAADPAGVFAQDPLDGIQRQDRLYDIVEEISAAYIQASFSGGDRYPYRGNFGVRYAKTKQSSRGFVGAQDGANFVPLDPNEPEVTTNREYSDLLPSFNVAWDLTDEWVARFAASKTVTRPDPVDLRQGWDFDSDYDDAWDGDANDQVGNSGNPDLAPYRTDNFDTSLEWYPEVGGAYAFGIFYKKLDGFITDGVEFVDIDLSVVDPEFGVVTYEINRPVNTDGGTVKGAEFALHTPFDTFTDGFLSHFGINASVTYVDAALEAVRGNGRIVSLRGTSEWSGNFVTYFELEKFSARLAYNTRDDYLHQEAVSANDFDEYTKGQEYVTLNLDYRFNENWRLRFTGNNLTDSQRYRLWENKYFSDQRDDGRTFVLELRGRM